MKIAILFIFLYFNSYVFGKEIKGKVLHIESNKLIIKENISEFIGNVFAQNGVYYLWGEKMIVEFNNNDKIEFITIIGNVIVKQENEEAKGDYAIYNLWVEKINLKGNVSLTKEESILTGDELTLDLINSTSIIKSNQENKVKAKIIK